MKPQPLGLNSIMPGFTGLPGVDGKNYSSSDFSSAEVLIIVFSCNHCPYVHAYEERLIALQRDYAPKNVRLVAINANDEVNYPEDSFEGMISRATKMKFPFAYVRDKTQSVAEAFGATHTPQFFLFDHDRRLRYAGKMDDNWQDAAAVKEHYLKDAIDAVLAGREVPVAETFSIGCTIKWR